MHRNWIALLLAVLPMAAFTGCTMCECPDDSYGYYGSLYQRPDPVYGRAGSILTGGDQYAAADAEVSEDGEPMVTDEPYYEE